MTLPEILALDPAQVRAKFFEAAGWKRSIIGTQDRHDPEPRGWLSPEGREKRDIPQLTLDTVAQAVAGLTDEEHKRYRIALDDIAHSLTGTTTAELWARWERIREDLPALQRARAFLCAKSE